MLDKCSKYLGIYNSASTCPGPKELGSRDKVRVRNDRDLDMHSYRKRDHHEECHRRWGGDRRGGGQFWPVQGPHARPQPPCVATLHNVYFVLECRHEVEDGNDKERKTTLSSLISRVFSPHLCWGEGICRATDILKLLNPYGRPVLRVSSRSGGAKFHPRLLATGARVLLEHQASAVELWHDCRNAGGKMVASTFYTDEKRMMWRFP